MHKKVKTLLIAFFIVGAVTTTIVLFAYSSTPKGIEGVADANNQFAFDLYSNFDESEEGNIFYSPYSIFSAMAMTYEGAKGQTADEMESVFHFPIKNVLRPNFASIYNEINREKQDYELKTANALWGLEDYPFHEDYINLVEEYYGGKISNVNFMGDGRKIINDYIENQTNGNIEDIIPDGIFNQYTRLVLTNAIYFNGTWKYEFDESNTFNGNFAITPEDFVSTPMMHMNTGEEKLNYADLNDLQILELPYKGDNVSMLILLPTTNLDSIVHSLSAEKLNEYKNQMQETSLTDIYLPKFEFDTKYFMEETLSLMGMPKAFSTSADFSGMTDNEELHINEVIHQGFIKVDEVGTEATAATVVIVDTFGPSPVRVVFNANHPFIFIIQEKQTGCILFLGRVNDPTN